jgi:hypothetical protein
MAQALPDGDDLIEDATKEDLADCAKVLAVALALYQRRYGDLDVEAGAPSGRAGLQDEVDDEFAAAMRTFVSVLSEVVEDNKSRVVH